MATDSAECPKDWADLIGTHACPTLEATRRLAARCATRCATRLAAPLEGLYLSGPLGSGKSFFARTLIREALGVPDLSVPSPSFLLRQDYVSASRRLVHLDLYRLSSGGPLDFLLADGEPSDFYLIEWPERLDGHYPFRGLFVQFQFDKRNPEARWISFAPQAPSGGIEPPPSPSR